MVERRGRTDGGMVREREKRRTNIQSHERSEEGRDREEEFKFDRREEKSEMLHLYLL